MTAPRRAALCLHGFTGTPFELEPLVAALGGAGFLVDAPLLHGHGGTVRQLAASSWRDWLQSAETAFDALHARAGGPVAIVGASAGGLLALRLARERRSDVSAVVLMAVPTRLHPIERHGVRIAGRVAAALGIGQSLTMPKWTGVDVRDPGMRARVPSHPRYPIAALASFVELMSVVRDDPAHVIAPALVAHGRRDATVPLRSSEELARRLRSSVIERLWLDRSAHLLPIDLDRAALSAAVTSFLTTHAGAPTRVC